MATARARIHRRQLVAIIFAACAITPVFNILTSRASRAEVIQGLVDAILISVLVGGYMIFVRDAWARFWFQRLGFRTDLALSSAIVLALFLVGRAVGQVATSLDPRRFVASFGDAHLIYYALPFFAVVAVTIQFLLQMNRLIGANVLGYFVAGVYHRPKAEERIFLFVDLVGSTQLAERLGSARYFDLLRRFVDDLTEPVLETGGEIYQYAGDEVVITWPMEAGLRAAGCVRCFFGIRGAIARDSARYQRDFGTVPAFRGGLHGGTVTAGELGDLRRQIVFVGDIPNTAARLEEYAKRTGFDLVASGAVLGHLTLPPGIAATPCGELALRGKEASVAAYGLSAG
ncbi:MAG TPA: adenylate/guanylate cyclase domain-containing protein [Candidatus Nitrosotalea sp.]|nr:adenylate/guanylate cyclase domain-containing protein [Candidatus Nitrosotalea sp.]